MRYYFAILTGIMTLLSRPMHPQKDLELSCLKLDLTTKNIIYVMLVELYNYRNRNGQLVNRSC